MISLFMSVVWVVIGFDLDVDVDARDVVDAPDDVDIGCERSGVRSPVLE